VSKFIVLLSALVLCALPQAASLRAQEKHPDFTGVY
jgi:hypothetical protein